MSSEEARWVRSLFNHEPAADDSPLSQAPARPRGFPRCTPVHLSQCSSGRARNALARGGTLIQPNLALGHVRVRFFYRGIVVTCLHVCSACGGSPIVAASQLVPALGSLCAPCWARVMTNSSGPPTRLGCAAADS